MLDALATGLSSWRNRVVLLLRLLWLVQPLVSGPLFANALADSGDPWQSAVSVGLWIFWAAGLAALLIPLPATLVAVRLIVPASFAAAGWAALTAGAEVATAAGLAATLAAALAALHPLTGDRFVDGASYGDERRMLLRPPAALLLGPVVLVWAAVVIGVVLGPLLAARELWVGAVLAAIVGWPVAAAGIRSLLLLVQRWLVFVPTGVVVRDLMTLQEPVLFGRDGLEFIGPALADTTGTDLTRGSLGLPLELQLIALTDVPIRRSVGRSAKASAPTAVRSLLVAPSLPGQALLEAERRTLPVH